MAGQTTSLQNLVAWPARVQVPSAWDSVQRLLDLILIAVTAPVWVPLLLFILALKIIIDGGPAIFHHTRLGWSGAPFVLYKIRTTPPGFQPRPDDWSDKSYPPRTPLGHLLRRCDLDELPQLWNVIRGDMSLVGPRPEMPAHARTFNCRIPEFGARLAVRPGLTGLAQVRGWRGNTSIDRRLASDLEYVGSRGPARYFGILARTIGVELQRLRGDR